MKLIQPHDYSAARDGERYFTFADGEFAFPCHPTAITWNGFDNVRISAETRAVLIAQYLDDGTPDGREQCAMIDETPADADGLIDLSNGWATELCQPDEMPAVRPACPNCGDETHLYALGNDVRWDAERQRWDILALGSEGFECTECDHGSGHDGGAALEDAGLPEPHAIIVQPVDQCTACGRDSLACSIYPCAAVEADRAS